MARYDYRCPSCEAVFEVEHPMSEHPVIICPDCGAQAERVFSPSGIRLVGSGFYNTDQRGGSSSSGSHSDGKESGAASSSTHSPCENCPHKDA